MLEAKLTLSLLVLDQIEVIFWMREIPEEQMMWKIWSEQRNPPDLLKGFAWICLRLHFEMRALKEFWVLRKQAVFLASLTRSSLWNV